MESDSPARSSGHCGARRVQQGDRGAFSSRSGQFHGEVGPAECRRRVRHPGRRRQRENRQRGLCLAAEDDSTADQGFAARPTSTREANGGGMGSRGPALSGEQLHRLRTWPRHRQVEPEPRPENVGTAWCPWPRPAHSRRDQTLGDVGLPRGGYRTPAIPARTGRTRRGAHQC